ncbi:hypothetical protein J5N97_015262 [Dioscorea zingiberensis]|uniref:Late embryogenesis abundant protein Lea5 n=1 Tax=Dioscorea zingiberensis TaxID=325984 RepID=A0A9D5HKI8_9LILI|nr:hypothetical protein J5N97_015262 [Dioscorea zingiberensis]
MALSLLNKNLFTIISRRAYSVAAAMEAGTKGKGMEEKVAMMSGNREGSSGSGAGEAACSWVPDPVTGYYRPANRLGEMDAAELREMLLSHKSRF